MNGIWERVSGSGALVLKGSILARSGLWSSPFTEPAAGDVRCEWGGGSGPSGKGLDALGCDRYNVGLA